MTWQPFPPPSAPVERVVLAPYWTLAKNARHAVCEGIGHPLGIEVTVTVDGELIRAEVARTGDLAHAVAGQWAAAFIDKGWEPSGPERPTGAALRWALHRRGLDVLCESISRPDGGFDLVLSLCGLTIDREICPVRAGLGTAVGRVAAVVRGVWVQRAATRLTECYTSANPRSSSRLSPNWLHCLPTRTVGIAAETGDSMFREVSSGAI